MAEVDLLRALPKGRRDIGKRQEGRSAEAIAISRRYGKEYFDGPRDYGYGGYFYDGRWVPVAKDVCAHFDLRPGSKILDIGAAKGFLVKDLTSLGIDAFGIDVSHYAIINCEKDIAGRIHLGSATSLPFPDNSFDGVVCINTLHNLPNEEIPIAISEINRVLKDPSKAFIQVDSFHDERQKAIFESWVLTAKFYDYPAGWVKLFEQSGYQGDWYWTVIE